MKRLFLATNPLSIATILAWKKLKPAEAPFQLNPLGFNAEAGRFETLVPGKYYPVIMVNDSGPDPLAGVEVHPAEDYLVYHKNWLRGPARDAILECFSPSRTTDSSHTNDPATSAFARVLSTLCEGLPEGIEALIGSLMSETKREIKLFLCDFEKLPPHLPESLAALSDEYVQIRELSQTADAAARSAADQLSDRKKAFIRQCLDIYDKL